MPLHTGGVAGAISASVRFTSLMATRSWRWW